MFDLIHRKYTCRLNDKLKKLIAPWEKKLFISQFCYYTIDNEGNYTSISSNADFAEFFFDQKLYSQCPYLVHPKHFVSGISLTNIIREPLFQEQMTLIQEKFNFKKTITIIQKHENGFDGYVFSSKEEIPYIVNMFINEIPLFRLFIKRFNQEFKTVKRQMDEERVYLPPHVGTRFHRSVEMIPVIGNKKEFLSKQGIDCPKMTPRQLTVMRCMAKGATNKEIALALGLSVRTVEQYIDILRGNFLCETKNELEQKALELQNYGLL